MKFFLPRLRPLDGSAADKPLATSTACRPIPFPLGYIQYTDPYPRPKEY